MPNSPFLLLLIALAGLAYLIGLTLHRLFFNRIAHIPGPRLAALSTFYQFYYDVYPHRGQFIFQCQRLHDIYGPVIRIGPDEIHVNDLSFYNEIYPNASRPRDRSKLWFWMSGGDDFFGRSTFATLQHDLHRVRRGAFGQFFSRQRVLALQPMLVEKVEALKGALLRRSGTEELVDLRDACGALTLEVITKYTLGQAIPVLDSPDMGKLWNEIHRVGVKIHPLARTFPWLTKQLLTLPDWIMAGNELWSINEHFKKELKRLVTAAFEDSMRSEKESKQHVTILHEIVESEQLPPAEKTLSRLQNEAGVFIGAGMETTGRTLAVTLYHILAEPTVYKRLREELKTVVPSPSAPVPAISALEKLPFLTAVLTEGVRISHGTAGRQARVAPNEDLDYHGIKIPRGTTMSQSNYLLHTNGAVFPDPLNFHPERFLGAESAKASQSMVPFGRGPRMCVGMNLAWAELYLTIAVLITSVKMELVDTTLRDATVDAEYFIGCLPVDSKGIRVRILGEA